MIDILVPVAVGAAFLSGLSLGVYLRDRVWRVKANGPARMLSGGRFYQVLTSEAYEELIRSAR